MQTPEITTQSKLEDARRLAAHSQIGSAIDELGQAQEMLTVFWRGAHHERQEVNPEPLSQEALAARAFFLGVVASRVETGLALIRNAETILKEYRGDESVLVYGQVTLRSADALRERLTLWLSAAGGIRELLPDAVQKNPEVERAIGAVFYFLTGSEALACELLKYLEVPAQVQ